MKIALITLCKALGQALTAYHLLFDRETSDLMAALAAYVEKNQER